LPIGLRSTSRSCRSCRTLRRRPRRSAPRTIFATSTTWSPTSSSLTATSCPSSRSSCHRPPLPLSLDRASAPVKKPASWYTPYSSLSRSLARSVTYSFFDWLLSTRPLDPARNRARTTRATRHPRTASVPSITTTSRTSSARPSTRSTSASTRTSSSASTSTTRPS